MFEIKQALLTDREVDVTWEKASVTKKTQNKTEDKAEIKLW